MAGINDVAKDAGVSTASVSRVLSGQNVRADVRRKVMAAVERLNYRPNRAARSLRSSKTMTLGLIVADIQNSYFTEVCRAVEDAASAGGYSVFLCNSDEDPAKEAKYLGLLRDENVAGVIVAPTAETLRTLKPGKNDLGPTVVIDRPSGTVDAVLIDNAAAARELTAHLLQHGRRRIAGLFGAHSATGRERHRGFVEAHAAAKVSIDESLVRFIAPREKDGFDAASELLALPQPPDAMLTSNGLLAAGVYRAMRVLGVRCPEQLGLCSFDNTAWSSMVSPALTVIEQPTYEIGRAATELLLARIAEPDRSPRSVVLPHTLIRRRSCGCVD